MVKCKFCNRVFSEPLEVCKGCGAILPRMQTTPPTPAVAMPRPIPPSASKSPEIARQAHPTGVFFRKILGLSWRIFCGFLITMLVGMAFTGRVFVISLVFAFIFAIPFVVSWVRRGRRPYPHSSGVILPILGFVFSLLLLASDLASGVNIGFLLCFVWFLILSIVRLRRDVKTRKVH